jgi:hypothetical protein
MSRETRTTFAIYLLHRMISDSIDATTSPSARILARAHAEFVGYADSSRAACLTAPAVSTTAEAREPFSSGQPGAGWGATKPNQTHNNTRTDAADAAFSPVV